MKIADLARVCVNAINQKAIHGLSGAPMISLELPENKHCPKQRKLFGKKGPFGQVVAFGFDGFDTVLFNAIDVLAYLTAMGLVEFVEEKEQETNDQD
jgi:hypothetical protein